MERCWAGLRQRGSKSYPIFLPAVSMYTCIYRDRLWAQPSLHREYTREEAGKWTQGTVLQHLPICLSPPTFTILPIPPKLPRVQLPSKIPRLQGVFAYRILYPPPLSEYTKVSAGQRPPARTTGCLKRQKTQVFHIFTKDDQNDFPVLASTSTCSNKWFCSVMITSLNRGTIVN